jgi:hypothetical protein
MRTPVRIIPVCPRTDGGHRISNSLFDQSPQDLRQIAWKHRLGGSLEFIDRPPSEFLHRSALDLSFKGQRDALRFMTLKKKKTSTLLTNGPSCSKCRLTTLEVSHIRIVHLNVRPRELWTYLPAPSSDRSKATIPCLKKTPSVFTYS